MRVLSFYISPAPSGPHAVVHAISPTPRRLHTCPCVDVAWSVQSVTSRWRWCLFQSWLGFHFSLFLLLPFYSPFFT